MGKFIDADMLKENGFVLAKIKTDKSGEITELMTVLIDDAPAAAVFSKSEVVRIFEEIDRIIDMHYNNHIFGDNDLDDIEKDAIINYSDDVSYDINKLKEQTVLGNEQADDGAGEWIMSPDGIKPMTCSKCGMPALFEITKNQFADTEIVRVSSKFCPHCGKIMKNAEK